MLRYLPLLLALLCWSWPPVIARRLGLEGIDVFTQNVVRMASSALVFIPLAFYFRPVEMKAAARRWRRFILPALFLAIAQTCWYYGLLKIGATFSSLLGRTDILLTVLVGVMFFADEREVVYRKGFVPALILTVIGVVGVILFRKGATGRVETEGLGFFLGVSFTFMSSVFWVAYVYAIKLTVGGVGAIPTLVTVNTLSLVFLAIIWAGTISVGLATPGTMVNASAFEIGAIVFSGLIGMGGGVFYIHSIEDVGATVSQCGILAHPLTVGVLSLFWLDERLATGQMVSGAVLLGGLAGVIYLEYRSRRAKRLLERNLTCTGTFR